MRLERVKKDERIKLENVLQLYLYDLNFYFPIPFDSNLCKYEYDLNKYFKDNYAYFIKEDNNILGFILIDKIDKENYEISEIFVMNVYRKNKIGKKVAFIVFDKHKGNWIVKTVPKSPVAESFWHKVIDEYTSGNFTLEYIGKYNRAVFTFSNK